MKTKGSILIQRDANKWPGILESLRLHTHLFEYEYMKIILIYENHIHSSSMTALADLKVNLLGLVATLS